MILRFGYLYVCYALFLFLEKSENKRLKKTQLTKIF